MKYIFSLSLKIPSKIFNALIIPQKHSILFVIFMMCCFNCTNTFLNKTNQSKLTGDIYGKVYVSGNSKLVKNIQVFIQNKAFATRTDSNGYFYITNVPPGLYSVTARTKGYGDCTINQVKVSNDSITILSQHSIYESTYIRKWDGIKIKRVNINFRGNLSGSVVDLHSNKVIHNAAVDIIGTPWGAYTDSAGAFKIEDILPGSYTVIVSRGRFHITIILDVIIQAKKTSLAEIGMIPDGIPERPLPYKWVPSFSNY